MVTWNEFETAEPVLAAKVRASFEAGRHKTMATLRADGSPRISGTECEFVDGRLQLGSMTGSRKGAELVRDPRCALHGPTFHPEPGRETDWPGEAKIAGLAELAGALAGEDGDTGAAESQGELFVIDVREVVHTGLNDAGTALVVEWWTPEGGRRRIERE